MVIMIVEINMMKWKRVWFHGWVHYQHCQESNKSVKQIVGKNSVDHHFQKHIIFLLMSNCTSNLDHVVPGSLQNLPA